jgi:hypothetical protein
VILPALACAVAVALGVVPAAPAAVGSGPQSLCTLGDERLEELSGLAVDASGVWGIPDDGRKTSAYRIDPETCEVVETRSAAIDPRDTEDLAVGPDGSLWVADIGDNDRERPTVAVIVLPARGKGAIHRFTYPDGPHNAEALLVDADGAPVIVTKDAGAPAGIYRPRGPFDGPGPTPLKKVGQFALPVSDTTGGPLGGLGSRVVTGAALSADRGVLAVRTYTDAWLYPVPKGDVVAALTASDAAPVQVPLPDEPQGEAVAFQPDGTLLSGSERRDGTDGELRAVRGAAALAGSGVATGGRARPAGARDSATDELPAWLPAALGVAGVSGVLALVTAGFALRRG